MTALPAGPQPASQKGTDEADALGKLISQLESLPPPPATPASADEEEVHYVLLELDGGGELHGELGVEVSLEWRSPRIGWEARGELPRLHLTALFAPACRRVSTQQRRLSRVRAVQSLAFGMRTLGVRWCLTGESWRRCVRRIDSAMHACISPAAQPATPQFLSTLPTRCVLPMLRFRLLMHRRQNAAWHLLVWRGRPATRRWCA